MEQSLFISSKYKPWLYIKFWPIIFSILVFTLMSLDCFLAAVSNDPSDVVNSRQAVLYFTKCLVIKSFRSPKLFYVTTVSSTSTISSTTICFVKSANFANAACKRRKRRMLVPSRESSLEIQPSDPVTLDSGVGEEESEEIGRMARFALYWKTTTLTSSTTTYTGTSTLASLYCTPSVFAYSLCG